MLLICTRIIVKKEVSFSFLSVHLTNLIDSEKIIKEEKENQQKIDLSKTKIDLLTFMLSVFLLLIHIYLNNGEILIQKSRMIT